MSAICVFAPGVLVTVTIEDHPSGEQLHFHAGGQGTWVARMGHRLGARSSLCTPLGGETATSRARCSRARGSRCTSCPRTRIRPPTCTTVAAASERR